jgi:error-prone DNA polymerase
MRAHEIEGEGGAWRGSPGARLTDLSAELATVGSRDAPFSLPHGRGDEVHGGGGPDPRERPPKGLRTRDIHVADLHIDAIKVKSRNFH